MGKKRKRWRDADEAAPKSSVVARQRTRQPTLILHAAARGTARAAAVVGAVNVLSLHHACPESVMYNPHYGTVRLQADPTAGCGGATTTTGGDGGDADVGADDAALRALHAELHRLHRARPGPDLLELRVHADYRGAFPQGWVRAPPSFSPTDAHTMCEKLND